jgi:hypothetical protein
MCVLAGLARRHEMACALCGRGKLLNVRDASAAQISGNAEITNIKQIMGLQHGKVPRHPPEREHPTDIKLRSRNGLALRPGPGIRN